MSYEPSGADTAPGPPSRQDLALALRKAIRRSERRQNRDLSPTALARRINISASSLYAYLKGQTLLRGTTLDKLLDELEATPAERRELSTLRDSVEMADQLDRPAARRTGAAVPTPRQLPPAPRGFAGRRAELRALGDFLAGRGEDAPLIVVLHGPPGVGKTALALHWAHEIKDRYPDGQLHVNLRGFDPDLDPDPGLALEALLHGLGVAPEAVPGVLEAKAALFRTLTADRSLLLILDNARSAEHVRPLLPSTPGSAVIVTSRDHMDGLAVREGAHRVALPVLPYREALALLERRLGGERLAAEAEAADELVELCARLPLALSVAATRAKPSLEAFVRRTREIHDRLEAFGSTEPDLDLGTVFRTSYALVPEPGAALFRLTGLHHGPDFDEYACAALLGRDVSHARSALRLLTAGSLVAEQPAGRFGSHDLLRAFARRLAEELPEEERHAAVTRLLDYHLDAVVSAAERIQEFRKEDLPDAPRAWPLPKMDGYGEVMDWLHTALPALRALVAQAHAQGFDAHAWRLARACNVYLRRSGRVADRVWIHRTGLAAAVRSGPPEAVAVARRLLGDALARAGETAEALSLLERSHEECSDLGDLRGVFQARLSLSRAHEAAGDPARALAHAAAALTLTTSLADPLARADGLITRARQEERLGRADEALRHASRARRLYCRLGYREGQADALRVLGRAELRLGRPAEAVSLIEESLEIDRSLGDRFWEAHKLHDLADALEAAGDHASSRAYREKAWSAFTALRHPTADLIRARLDGTSR